MAARRRAQPIADHVRCGSQLYAVTWPRFCGVTLLLLLAAYLPAVLRAPASAGAGVDLAATAAGAGGQSAAEEDLLDHPERMLTVPTPIPVPDFCAGEVQVPSRQDAGGVIQAALGALGKPGFPTSEADAMQRCAWREATNTEPAFPICVFPNSVDGQVSKYILEGGEWNPSKKELVQAALPLARDAIERDAARTRRVFIDVGANVGFFSALAAMRGFDAIAIEPVIDAASLLTATAHRNGIHVLATMEALRNAKTARTARVAAEVAAFHAYDHGVAQPGLRGAADPREDGPQLAPDGVGTLTILRGAVMDRITAVDVSVTEGNIGASNVRVAEKTGDGFVDPGRQDATMGFPLDALVSSGAINPEEVAMVKISAEGMDSLAIRGMLKLVTEGRVPFIHFVFNTHHVRGAGCNPRQLLHSLVRGGYRLWDFGVSRTSDRELMDVIRKFDGRSVELLFVEKSVRF